MEVSLMTGDTVQRWYIATPVRTMTSGIRKLGRWKVRKSWASEAGAWKLCVMLEWFLVVLCEFRIYLEQNRCDCGKRNQDCFVVLICFCWILKLQGFTIGPLPLAHTKWYYKTGCGQRLLISLLTSVVTSTAQYIDIFDITSTPSSHLNV